ncbi:MAG: hypothetical protein QXQ16_00990 [Candidatus Aenigmatarchaeota archaeon]
MKAIKKILLVFLFFFTFKIEILVSQSSPWVGTNPPTGQYHHISEIWINTSSVDWRGLEFTNISRLGIGTTSPAERLHVSGNARIDGNLLISGTAIITSGRILQNIQNVATNLTPSSDNTYDLGSSTNRWKNVFAVTVNANQICIGADCRSSWPAGNITGSGSPGQVAFWTGTSSIGGDSNLSWDNTNKRLGIGTTSPAERLDVAGNIRVAGNIYPSSNNVYSIGTSSNMWANIYATQICFNSACTARAYWNGTALIIEAPIIYIRSA